MATLGGSYPPFLLRSSTTLSSISPPTPLSSHSSLSVSSPLFLSYTPTSISPFSHLPPIFSFLCLSGPQARSCWDWTHGEKTFASIHCLSLGALLGFFFIFSFCFLIEMLCFTFSLDTCYIRLCKTTYTQVKSSVLPHHQDLLTL